MKGRKRFLLCDTLGNILHVMVCAASTQEREGGKVVLEAAKEKCPRLETIFVDNGYNGAKFRDWVLEKTCWKVEVVKHAGSFSRYAFIEGDEITAETYQAAIARWKSRKKGFVVLKKRWVVERTNAWVISHRRLRVDYEYLPETTEAWIYLVNIRLLIRRLAQLSNQKAIGNAA